MIVLGILAIPYYSYGGSTGLCGISQKGVIPAQAVSSGYGAYDDTVDRSVIIGSDIYAIAHRTVKLRSSAIDGGTERGGNHPSCSAV